MFQQPLLLAVGLVVLVIGTPSETGMTEVEEDRFVCLACQALHFQAIYCSRRALHTHMTKSKNPKCPHDQEQESQVCVGVEQNKGYYLSRQCDCWWSLWNGALPSQPQGEEYTHNILFIFNLHTV